MSLLEILSGLAALITLIGTSIAIIRWLEKRKKSSDICQPHTGIPYWDVTIIYDDETPNENVVARLTVVGATKEEASHKAKQLVEQWQQVSLGLEILSGKTIPNDDEGKPLSIIRPDLLPQFDGDSKALTVSLAKREPPGFPGVAFFRKLSYPKD